MNVLDLFSGIGGFSLGLERAGMRTVAFCERDEYCRAVLRKHWPGVPCFDDIHTLDADRLGGIGRIDLVCGGFPCQPFSVAGKQRAQEDDRHLWPEMRRVIALTRPAWVIGENVAGLIPLALDDVLADLETLGYTSRALVIPACAVDAKHRRDRVWIIARDANIDRQSAGAINAEEVAELRGSTADATAMQRRSIQRDESDGTLSGDAATTDADGNAIRNESRWGRWARWEGTAKPRDVGEGDGSDADSTRLAQWQGKRGDDGAQRTATLGACRWEPEPTVGRVANGVPRRVDRLRTLGNAVVPQIVEEIGRAIMLSV